MGFIHLLVDVLHNGIATFDRQSATLHFGFKQALGLSLGFVLSCAAGTHLNETILNIDHEQGCLAIAGGVGGVVGVVGVSRTATLCALRVHVAPTVRAFVIFNSRGTGACCCCEWLSEPL